MRSDQYLISILDKEVKGLTVGHLIDIMKKIENVMSTIDANTEQASALIEWANTFQHMIEEHITLEELSFLEENNLLQ